ncbi:MAG: ROK family transcriptional regulator [Candidatus Omnitrophica bacterium]|nr:ROK family transcriptional regulator [Candidatus Omnitrophota bacterium]
MTRRKGTQGVPTEQGRKRAMNRYKILKTLHLQGPLQRFQLASLCNIRKSSVTSIVNELVDSGLVTSQDHRKKRNSLVINGTGRHAAVAELSPGLVRVAKVSLTGKIHDIKEKKVPEGTVLRKLMNIALGMLKMEVGNNKKKIIGIGISCPGFIDSKMGVCIQAANIPGSQNILIQDFFKKYFRLPVLVENDVRCGLWASVWFEQLLKDFQNVFYVEITHGVGGALLVQGAIIEGCHFAAGEFGHIKAGDEGRNCRCGKKDCLETYCSIPAISREIRAISHTYRNVRSAEDITRSAEKNQRACKVLDKTMGHMARALIPVVAILDPQAFVLGNQESNFYNVLIPFLQKHILQKIFAAHSGKNAAIKGIGGIVMENYFKSLNV